MLALDFINIGNGDCILIREMEGTQQKFALMVDFGHDCLIRDDHPGELDPRSQRIYAGDFLRELGVTHLDVALATHFHRDHIGGLGRVLDAVTIDRFYTTYLPPEGCEKRPSLPPAVYASAAKSPRTNRALPPDSGNGDGLPPADAGPENGYPLWRTGPVPAAEGDL